MRLLPCGRSGLTIQGELQFYEHSSIYHNRQLSGCHHRQLIVNDKISIQPQRDSSMITQTHRPTHSVPPCPV